jgi:PilZ domain
VANEDEEKMIGLAAQELERRGMPRCAVDEEAALVLVNQGKAIRGRMVELSASVCRIVLEEKLPRGVHTVVEASFRLRGIAFRLSGLTEWTSGGNAVGVSFGPMSARRRDDLLEVLCEVEAGPAAQANNAAGDGVMAERPSVDRADAPPAQDRGLRPEPNPDFEPEGAAAGKGNFLLAHEGFREGFRDGAPEAFPGFFQTGNGDDATAAGDREREGGSPGSAGEDAGVRLRPSCPAIQARASFAVRDGAAMGVVGGDCGKTAGNVSDNALSAGADGCALAGPPRNRRVQARCGVETSAAIRLIKIGSILAGQIVDVSMGGCRIRTAERFPVGIYTRVEVEFRLRGTPLLLGGVVQAIHGRKEVGIRFLDVSARKQEQLSELIAEVKAVQSSEMQSSGAQNSAEAG